MIYVLNGNEIECMLVWEFMVYVKVRGIWNSDKFVEGRLGERNGLGFWLLVVGFWWI